MSLYRSRVEQIDDPDARLEGQPPWRLTLGAERQWAAGHGAGATLLHTPGFSTQQSDRQRLWRSAQTRLDAFVSWRQAGAGQWRLAVVSALAPAQRSRSAVSDFDGFDASAATQRDGVAQWTASFVTRF